MQGGMPGTRAHWRAIFMLALSMPLVACVVQPTRNGYSFAMDEAMLFSSTLQTLAWRNGNAVLRRTANGDHEVKLTGIGPIVDLGKRIEAPRIERIDVVDGRTLMLVSASGSRSCSRAQYLYVLDGHRARRSVLRGACITPQVRTDGRAWTAGLVDGGDLLAWTWQDGDLWRERTRLPQPAAASARKVATTGSAQAAGVAPAQTAAMPPPRRKLQPISGVETAGPGHATSSREASEPVRVDISDH